ncbi:hypothetical protein GGF42_000212, partial [Coemansia sp. RSA 2424]
MLDSSRSLLEKHRREPSSSDSSTCNKLPAVGTPKKMALFKSGFGSLLSKAASASASPLRPPLPPPPPPPPPPYSLTNNIRAIDGYATVGSRPRGDPLRAANGHMSASLPCIPRLTSAPIVAVVQKTPETEIVEGTAGLRASCLSADNALAHNPPAAAVVCGQSDTDDDSGIAASVTRLVSTTDCIANQLSPRLSLRLSVDASGMFAATGSALGLSAFVAPLAAASSIPEEETPLSAVEETTMNADSVEEEEDPVRARLRSLRSRRLANPTTEDSATGGGGGRRFRATQSARGGPVLPSKQGEKPLAKMGNLQLD